MTFSEKNGRKGTTQRLIADQQFKKNLCGYA
jgi:hypothetical protein